MIITVNELKTYIDTNKSDQVLEGKLQALELLIRKYTNNNFQFRNIRFRTDVIDGGVEINSPLLQIGDTIQISQSKYNDGLYTVRSIDGEILRLSDVLLDDDNLLVTKIKYPEDVKKGVADMVDWDLKNRNKVGVQSETISRHSVTYFNMDGDNSKAGYPKSLLGFLEPYRRARF